MDSRESGNDGRQPPLSTMWRGGRGVRHGPRHTEEENGRFPRPHWKDEGSAMTAETMGRVS